ncbi:hypothetical protein JQ620_09385 [Bradyrhizobium sp. AUGA SZCCT0274]|uniref:hypothetical protein n=1 Tax=Bradyrhizobium sp. AUGA SZCCT0274 TaxID=2807670 RepID=UPI001BAAF74F|nr:hypothetical protein [Bradyrhizobium sp. AUGA SZCCT0274]MBR1240337.1 hypothetical protein [Bradyrhizobium sp. AUGA SZCCT0274]
MTGGTPRLAVQLQFAVWNDYQMRLPNIDQVLDDGSSIAEAPNITSRGSTTIFKKADWSVGIIAFAGVPDDLSKIKRRRGAAVNWRLADARVVLSQERDFDSVLIVETAAFCVA